MNIVEDADSAEGALEAQELGGSGNSRNGALGSPLDSSLIELQIMNFVKWEKNQKAEGRNEAGELFHPADSRARKGRMFPARDNPVTIALHCIPI